MTITLSLPPEIEQQLYQRAAAAGVPAEAIVLDALAEQFDRSSQPDSALTPLQEESRLLAAINQRLPEATLRRYYALMDRRRDETLTEAEHAELITLNNVVEQAHVARLEKVFELARLKGIEVKVLMKQLGLGNPGYA
jgi:hypothetical protein